MDYKSYLKIFKIEELPSTIEGCHSLILSHLEIISGLFKRVEKLEIENRELKERLNSNSSNSSLPPSRSFKKEKPKHVSKNKSGGQTGHEGHYRQLLDSSKVDVIIDCKLPPYCSCGGTIDSSGEYQRHQVYELPEIRLKVTEYRLEKGCCSCCGRSHVGALPNGITCGITGPKLTGFMSHLISKYHLSRRELKEFLEEQFQFNLSLGSVFNKQKIVNAALETPVANLLAEVKKSSSINIDETGHNRDGKKQWLWGLVTSSTAFFSVQPSRGKKVLDFLVGDFTNIVISDRYTAYSYFDSSCRQICWAHLKRDFTRLAEKYDKVIARIGKNLLACEIDLFNIWHEFKQSNITRDELLRKSQPIRRRVGELLEQGTYTDPALKAARLCKNLLDNFDALWTFLSVDNVEPTNNHAERCLRNSVIWRKKYFCTRSDYGSEFVARTASINMTCKIQSKSSFEFICQRLKNYFTKTTAPPALITA
ncbi:transposase [Gammaproteobacteria bacterium]